ncbi:MAG: hypothetical protein JSU95_04045, partial [Betaproteobacteria bacterium]
GLKQLIDSLEPNELMITAHIYNQQARLRSVELVAQVRDRMAVGATSQQPSSDLTAEADSASAN